MQRSRFVSIVALLVSCVMQSGCMSIDVRLAHFMSPDRGSRSATLPKGYAVQDSIIHRGDELIGITHAHHPESSAVVLFCGGDAFHRSIEGGEMLEALALGADVILFDYPGYGESTGSPGATAVLDTALAVYDYAAALEESAGKKRVVYGFALGGLVAAQVVRHRRVDGLVLEATAPNAERWARSQLPWIVRPFVVPRAEPDLASMDSVAALTEFPAQFQGPVLLLASKTDVQTPASLSSQMERELRAAGVRAQLLQFPHARHGEIAHAPEFAPVLRRFLDRLQAGGPQWASAQF
jgi:pimeloyl-ACP methyl ester carboxylesterase